MQQEEVRKIVKETLEKMGCADILFSGAKENLLVATFNCKEITSFVADIPGWFYSGIHLDPTKERQFKIDFKKLS